VINCGCYFFVIIFSPLTLTKVSTPLHQNYTVTFANQTVQWNACARTIIPVEVSKTLVAAWIGINDVGDSRKYKFPLGNATFESFYAEIIKMEVVPLETLLFPTLTWYAIITEPFSLVFLNSRPCIQGQEPLPLTLIHF
jgi:hypothetical protein